MSTKIQSEAELIAEHLHSAAIHLLRKLRREDEASGLSAPRLSALSVIVFGSPLSLGDLAAAEQVRPPTMTRIVDALEQQGLVVRKKNTEDGRSTMLSATAAGKSLLFKGRARRVRSLSRRIAALAPEDKAILERATRLVAAIVRDL